MARGKAARLVEDGKAGPISRIIAPSGQIIGKRLAGFVDLAGGSADHMSSQQQAEACPKAQARTSWPSSITRPS